MSQEEKDGLQSVNIELRDSIEKDKWYSLRMGSDPLFSPPSTFFTNVDTKHKILICSYFALSIAAYIILHWYFYQPSDPLCDLFANFSASFITIDITFVLLTFIICVATDFWKMGFSIYTYILFMIFSLVVAIGIIAPLYMALRISRQCKLNSENNNNNDKNKISYWQSFIPFTIYMALMIFFLIGPTAFQEPPVCTN